MNAKMLSNASLNLKATANQWTYVELHNHAFFLGITMPPSGNTFWLVNWSVSKKCWLL